ncbi:hypothetical protein [Streptomyces sp. NPDC046805]|uniref:hypothetical protein n=1 Tax=Streptomyces sp. NPDC046805 TaxID=3155134 RepID=UPI0033E41A5A
MRDVVRDVVGEVAPDELILVEGLFVVDDETALRRLSSRGQRREPLGFGLGEIAALVTPVVWMALDEAAHQIVSATVGAAGRRSGTWLRRIMRRPVAAPRILPPLAPEQLEAIRVRVVELAGESGMESPQAQALGERVVARLVLPGQPGAEATTPASRPPAPDEETTSDAVHGDRPGSDTQGRA